MSTFSRLLGQGQPCAVWFLRYVFWLLPGLALAQFTQQGSKLVGTGAAGVAFQGRSVSLSSDGNTALVGGSIDNNNAGAVWVYTRSGGVWTQQGSKLVGTGTVGNARQGQSVAVSGDGNTALVSGHSDNNNAGAVWVYTRSGGVWTQQGSKLVGTGAAGNAAQGYSVTLSSDGNTALVGGVDDNGGAGAVWVYTRSGGVWTQQSSKLVGTGAAGNAAQGYSVALSSDGNTALVGGYNDNGGAGAVWVFTRSGGVWTQQGSKLVGTGAVGITFQGSSVSLSSDGNTALVGGYYDIGGAGAVWAFVFLPFAPTNLQRNVSATYTTTDITLQWTDNATNETGFVLERGKKTSANQVVTDPALVWTAVSPAPATDATSYRDYAATGLTANGFGYFYRLKAVNAVGESAYVNNSDAALPVTLRYFNGRMATAGALLGWQTASETNNAYFSIERSRDRNAGPGLSFEAIGRVSTEAAGGNSGTSLTYSFTDAQPLPGVNYYRLVQVDGDGRRTPSKVIALSVEGQQTVLYPNPVGPLGEAVLEPALAYTGYELTDLLGRVRMQASEPGTLSRLSVGTLPAGVYVLRVQLEGGGQQVFRLVR